MANIVLEDIEVAAEKVLSFVTGAETKVNTAGPGAVAGLGVLLGAVATAISDGSSAAAADGLNIALDVTTATDIKQVWPDIVALAASLGIKL